MSGEWLFVPEEVRAFNYLMDDYMQVHNKNGPPRGYERYHPSAFGKCLRQMQYYRYAQQGFLPMPVQSVESNMLRLWEVGHHTQSRWEKYFSDLGIIRGVWRCVNPLCKSFKDDGSGYKSTEELDQSVLDIRPRVYGKEEKCGVFKPERCACGCTRFDYEEIHVEDKEMNLDGHCDMILDFSNLNMSKFEGFKTSFSADQLPKGIVVADMKTCNQYAWDNKVMKVGPSLEYQIQLTIYANILGCDSGLLIYENKNDSKTKAFKIPKNEDTWFPVIKEQARLMNEMVPHKKLPPPRSFTKSDYDCKYCPFAQTCHASKVWDDEMTLKEKRKKFYRNLLST